MALFNLPRVMGNVLRDIDAGTFHADGENDPSGPYATWAGLAVLDANDQWVLTDRGRAAMDSDRVEIADGFAADTFAAFGWRRIEGG